LESDEVDGTAYLRQLNDNISWRLGVQSNDKYALYDSTNTVTHFVAENNSLRSCIGIGTTNPDSAVVLDVVGPMRISGSTINRFRTLATTQYNYSADLSGGQLIKNGTGSADFVNVSQSLILLNDATNGGVDFATVDITDWVDNSQLGQQLEVVIVGDGTDEITQNGIQLQYFNAGNTIQINGGHTQNGAGSGTFGATYNYSSSVYNAPTKYVGASLKLMKTTSDNIKAWGTAMSGSIA
jgi:hypothetical protein